MRMFQVVDRSVSSSWPAFQSDKKQVHLSVKTKGGKLHHLYVPADSPLANGKPGMSIVIGFHKAKK